MLRITHCLDNRLTGGGKVVSPTHRPLFRKEYILVLSSRLLSKNVKVRIYKTIVLPVVLHGCETWSLTVREEYKLRALENRMLRRIFGLKRNGVTGGWRKLHN
jgi:hypothetical protein